MKPYSCVFNDGKGWCLHYQLWCRAFPNCKGYSAEEKHQLDTAQTTLPNYHLAEIVARDCLRILEEKDLLLGAEE